MYYVIGIINWWEGYKLHQMKISVIKELLLQCGGAM